MLIRGKADQQLRVFAFNHLSGKPIEDDQDQITCHVRVDDQSAVQLDAEHPIQETPKSGYYYFPLTVAEVDGATLDFTPVSATPNVVVIVPYHNRHTQPDPMLSYELSIASRYIDSSYEPWREVYIRKGSGDLDTGVRLLSRELYDVNGDPITSIKQFVASAVTVSES